MEMYSGDEWEYDVEDMQTPPTELNQVGNPLTFPNSSTVFVDTSNRAQPSWESIDDITKWQAANAYTSAVALVDQWFAHAKMPANRSHLLMPLVGPQQVHSLGSMPKVLPRSHLLMPLVGPQQVHRR